jgi:hypothetical protein
VGAVSGSGAAISLAQSSVLNSQAIEYQDSGRSAFKYRGISEYGPEPGRVADKNSAFRNVVRRIFTFAVINPAQSCGLRNS